MKPHSQFSVKRNPQKINLRKSTVAAADCGMQPAKEMLYAI